MNNPYEVFDLPPDCSDEELEARYAALKAQYSEDRFLEGEEGRLGALHLEELNAAYAEIKAARAPSAPDAASDGPASDGPASEAGAPDDSASAAADTEQSDLDRIDALIKDNRIDEAQAQLDAMSSRSGRWHYLQAIIYYKRNWFSDSLRQLDIAIGLEPNNKQYKRSREILGKNMNGTPPPQGPDGQPIPPDAAQDNAMGLANCCTGLCMADCCCNSLRCCGCG